MKLYIYLLMVTIQVSFSLNLDHVRRTESANHYSRELFFCFLGCDFQSSQSTSIKNQCEFYDFNCNCQKEEWNEAFVNCSATAEKLLKRQNFSKDCLARKQHDCKCSLYCTNYAVEQSKTRCNPTDLSCLCQDQSYRTAFSQCPRSSSSSNDCSELLDIECFFAKADRESKVTQPAMTQNNGHSFDDPLAFVSPFFPFIPHLKNK